MHENPADYRPLVSVMIPFHNASDTLDRCLRSVVALTYRPLDVIIVDDASSDDGYRIVEGMVKIYAGEGLHIRLFRHETNRGVAAARACALTHAEGEYITAVDADDYIDPGAVDAYVAATDGGRADIVAGGVFYEYPGKSVPVLFRPGERLTLEEASIDSLHFLLTNKLLRTSMLREMHPFTPGQDCWEDLGAVSRMLASGACTVELEGALVPLYAVHGRVSHQVGPGQDIAAAHSRGPFPGRVDDGARSGGPPCLLPYVPEIHCQGEVAAQSGRASSSPRA